MQSPSAASSSQVRRSSSPRHNSRNTWERGWKRQKRRYRSSPSTSASSRSRSRSPCGGGRGAEQLGEAEYRFLIQHLWEVHKLQFEKFYAKPDTHPKYYEEWLKFVESRTKSVRRLHGDVQTYNFHAEWEITWPTVLQQLEVDEWKAKKEEALKPLHKKLKVNTPTKSPSEDRYSQKHRNQGERKFRGRKGHSSSSPTSFSDSGSSISRSSRTFSSSKKKQRRKRLSSNSSDRHSSESRGKSRSRLKSRSRSKKKSRRRETRRSPSKQSRSRSRSVRSRHHRSSRSHSPDWSSSTSSSQLSYVSKSRKKSKKKNKRQSKSSKKKKKVKRRSETPSSELSCSESSSSEQSNLIKDGQKSGSSKIGPTKGMESPSLNENQRMTSVSPTKATEEDQKNSHSQLSVSQSSSSVKPTASSSEVFDTKQNEPMTIMDCVEALRSSVDKGSNEPQKPMTSASCQNLKKTESVTCTNTDLTQQSNASNLDLTICLEKLLSQLTTVKAKPSEQEESSSLPLKIKSSKVVSTFKLLGDLSEVMGELGPKLYAMYLETKAIEMEGKDPEQYMGRSEVRSTLQSALTLLKASVHSGKLGAMQQLVRMQLVQQISEILEYGEGQPGELYGLNIVTLAQTLQNSPKAEAMDFIKKALIYKGIYVPTEEVVEELYTEILMCQLSQDINNFEYD